MKNKFITLLFVVVCVQAQTLLAKNDSTSVIKNGIGLSIAPMISAPSYVNGSNYNNNYLKAGVGGTAALCENIVLSKKQNFYLYAELGYQTSAYINNNIPNTLFIVNANGNVNYNNLSHFSLINRYNFGYFSLSIQKVLFHFGKKLGVFAGVGAQINYCYSTSQVVKNLLDTTGKDISSHYSTTSYSVPQNIQWSAAAVARIGLMANVTKHLALNIAPVFNFGLNPKYIFTNNNPGFNNFGLNLQIMYSF